MLETLAAGVPVVSTPASGATDALEPLADGHRPGVVVEAHEGALAAQLSCLFGNGAGRAAMAGAARKRARSRFACDDKVRPWEVLLGAE